MGKEGGSWGDHGFPHGSEPKATMGPPTLNREDALIMWKDAIRAAAARGG